MGAGFRVVAPSKVVAVLPAVFLAAALLAASVAVAGDPGPAAAAPRGTKVFYLDSYDASFQPSILTQKGARAVLEPAGVDMEVFYLDEKRHPDPSDQKAAAERARRRIAEWNPDLIIASDDPANEYVIVPFFRGGRLPVVFNGINWDASKYGYPAANVTGQVEVEVVKELLAELRRYARGDRVGFLSGDTTTDRESIEWYERILGLRFERKVLVKTFDEWKKAYAALQPEVDMVFLRTNGGVAGWNDAEADRLVAERSTVPSGSVAPHMGRWVLLNYAKVREEFGEWSAKTALRILSGTPPAEIPMTQNRQARALVNMGLAKKLGIRFPIEFLEGATFVEELRP